MTRLGTRISLLAAASLLFANIACTCAVAGMHAGHQTASDDKPHHVHHVHHGDPHSEHQHAAHAGAHAPDHEDDPSCQQMLADCADCGPGATPTIKQDRESRLPWMPSDHGDKADHLFASAAQLEYAEPAPRWSASAWRPRLPALGSPITRKDELTE